MNGIPEKEKTIFDRVSTLYDSVRPSYPVELVNDLIGMACLKPDSRVLEIGPGPGKLTRHLAERGLKITCIEIGPNLSEVARKNMSGFEDVDVITGDFDVYDFKPSSYDLVVTATSFHWLDERTRVSRIHDLLNNEGCVAIIDTVHVDAGHDDFPAISQYCYRKWDPDTTSDFTLPSLRGAMEGGFKRKDEFENNFIPLLDRSYSSNIEYDSKTYIKLLQTYSNVITMQEKLRNGFLECIGDIIERNFNGRITKSYLWQMFMARKN